jgi:hypothetical protein
MHTIARIVGVGVIAAGLSLAAVSPAAAHNYVVSSTPAEGEVLTSIPEFFVVTVNDSMLDLGGEGAGFAIQVTDDNGLFYGDGCVTVQGPSMSTPGALGDAGTYTMTFQYISADGHTLSDQLTFRFDPAADAVGSPGRTEAPVCGEPLETVEPTPTAEPSETAVAQPESSEPAAPAVPDESGTVIGVVLAIVGVLVVAGVVAGVVLWRRNRALDESEAAAPDAPEKE